MSKSSRRTTTTTEPNERAPEAEREREPEAEREAEPETLEAPEVEGIAAETHRVITFAFDLVLAGHSVDGAFNVAGAFEKADNDASTPRHVVDMARALLLKGGRSVDSAFAVARAFEVHANRTAEAAKAART